MEQLPCSDSRSPGVKKALGEGLGLKKLWEKGLNSACGCWDCLQLCPGALSCLAPAAPFIEPPGEETFMGVFCYLGLILDVRHVQGRFFSSVKASVLAH